MAKRKMQGVVGKPEIADEFAEREGLSKVVARQYFDDIWNIMMAHLENGDEVQLTSIGKFQMVQTPVKKGRNRYTKEVITIDSKRKIKFEMARSLRDKLNGVSN